MEVKNDDLIILNTIYDKVYLVADGIYATELNKKYGIVNKIEDFVVDAEFDTGIYRDRYALLGSENINRPSKLIIYKGDKEFILGKLKRTNYEEHSSVDFKVIELADLKDENIMTVIDTLNGKALFTYDKSKDAMMYRPGDYIILAIKKDGEDILGVTENMEFDTIDNLVNKRYKQVEKDKRGRYTVVDNEGNKVSLTRFGQRY